MNAIISIVLSFDSPDEEFARSLAEGIAASIRMNALSQLEQEGMSAEDFGRVMTFYAPTVTFPVAL